MSVIKLSVWHFWRGPTLASERFCLEQGTSHPQHKLKAGEVMAGIRMYHGLSIGATSEMAVDAMTYRAFSSHEKAPFWAAVPRGVGCFLC